jgi:hypothetical protein
MDPLCVGTLALVFPCPSIINIYARYYYYYYYYLNFSTDIFLCFSRFLNFLILYTLDRTHWTGHQPIARPLHTQSTAHNKRTQISMPGVGSEPATDGKATVIDLDITVILLLRCEYDSTFM